MANGIIFIPDISGFSAFVKNIEIKSGAAVASALLKAIIDENKLFEVSEIEGDAVLFYRPGNAVPIAVIIDQFQTMHAAFNMLK